MVYYGIETPCCAEFGTVEIVIVTPGGMYQTLFAAKQDAVVLGQVAHLWTVDVNIPPSGRVSIFKNSECLLLLMFQSSKKAQNR